MSDSVMKRRFENPLVIGVVLTILSFAVAVVSWPIWGLLNKALVTSLAAPGLVFVDGKTVIQYSNVLAEGTFFWLLINPWVWQTLCFGNYGKNYITNRQPGAGVWYIMVSIVVGLVGFIALIGFIGLWWKPFSLAVLFYPKTAAEVHLAIEGFEVANFYALICILGNISYVALLHKWPFAGNLKAPWDGYGTFMASTVFCLIAWIALIFPSLMSQLSLGDHVIVSKPFGSWPAFLDFCQVFILMFLLPSLGGEHYPGKLFSKKQPYLGMIGLLIAIIFGLIVPPILRPIVAFLNLLPGVPLDVVLASLELTVVCFLLTWHHLFDDYPSATLIPNLIPRLLIRFGIILTGGILVGIIWLKTFMLFPFGTNNFGMGVPTLGLLAGQFWPLLIILYINTFFDKWPVVYKETISQEEQDQINSKI